MIKTNHIAILLATYNGERYLVDQIESILAQSYTEWELFLHDDGSKDRTVQIIEDYASRYPDRIHLLEGEPTGGAKNNFFYLMNQIDAPYLMFCDQDDVWKENKISLTLKKMQEIEEEGVPCLVHSDLTVVDEGLSVISESMFAFQNLRADRDTFSNLLVQNIVTGCTMMINASLAKLSRIEEVKGIIMHDWWLALVVSKFGKIGFVEEGTIFYRQHGGNTVGAKHANGLGYMFERFFQSKKTKESLKNTREQAGVFADMFGDDLAREYSLLGEKGKLKRLCFYRKHNIKKIGFVRNLGLILFG